MTPILTDISDRSQIFFAESPIHFNLLSSVLGIAGNDVIDVELYIWRGFQADVPTTPFVKFLGLKRISPSDQYVNIEVSNEIRAFIKSANLNINNPQFGYNATSPATTAGVGVYFHICYQNRRRQIQKDLGTYFATTGYRYNFEQTGGMYANFIDVPNPSKYAKHINYSKFTFNFDTTVETSQSGTGDDGMIIQTVVDPADRLPQTSIPCIIVYVNKLGLWDIFTPFGKFTEEIDVSRSENAINFRNALNVNSQVQHLKALGLPKGMRKYKINTGIIDESDNFQIEQMMASSKMYLIVFENEIFTTTQVGITVDSTLITVDSLNITVDSDTVTEENIGFYSKFKQIPVKLSSSNFLKKTRLNDKSSISYTIELEETNNFANNI